MTTITDDFMKQMIAAAKTYTAIILKKTPVYNREQHFPLIWEHARRNFQLRAEGKLSIVCPVRDESEVGGIGIFNLGPDETRQLMDEDPAVKAGIFTYDVHPVASFPGDTLPG